ALATLWPRMAERLLAAQKPDEAAIATLINFIADRDDECTKACLAVVASKLDGLSQPVTLRLKTELKAVLGKLLARETNTPLFLSAQLLAARLGLAQLDPVAVRARFASETQPDHIRLQALEALIAFHDPELLTTLPETLSSSSSL